MTGYGEWHRFYCRFRELCGQRQCQPDAEHYDALWLRFLTDSGRSNPTRHQLPKVLTDLVDYAGK